MTLALVCSGQGNQHADMFALTAAEPAAAPVFTAAAALLNGTDPRTLVQDGGADLHNNRIGQILCCTQALAAAAVLRDAIGPRFMTAGYSIGELASWGIAGVIAAPDVLKFAVERAAAMDRAGGTDSGLCYTRGLDRSALDALCARHDAAIAICNPGGMFVIGGRRADLDALTAEALASGASHAGPLKVAVASHTAQLAAASEAFARTLGAATTKPLDPRVRLFSGIDGTAVRDIPDGLAKLARQISQTIDWAACLEGCREAGMTAALELGPGRALAAMVTATTPEVNARSLDDFRSLDGVRRWLAGLER